jgi:hypothetical protein
LVEEKLKKKETKKSLLFCLYSENACLEGGDELVLVANDGGLTEGVVQIVREQRIRQFAQKQFQRAANNMSRKRLETRIAIETVQINKTIQQNTNNK